MGRWPGSTRLRHSREVSARPRLCSLATARAAQQSPLLNVKGQSLYQCSRRSMAQTNCHLWNMVTARPAMSTSEHALVKCHTAQRTACQWLLATQQSLLRMHSGDLTQRLLSGQRADDDLDADL